MLHSSLRASASSSSSVVPGSPDSVAEIRAAFGGPAPLAADRIWQKAFDYDVDHLHRLAALVPGGAAAPADLIAYAMDFKYEQIQPDLFRHVFPFCLQAWHDDLAHPFGPYETFVDELYPALVRSAVLDGLLAPAESAAVAGFMRRAILAAIDSQTGLSFKGKRADAYAWLHAFTTYGVLFSDLAALWSTWWAVETPGRAIAAAQYASCLIYADTQNPVFDAWTKDGGGGPPCLWHYRGHLLDANWRDTNLGAAAERLTPDGVRAVLDRSAARLGGHPLRDKVASIRYHLDARTETLARRCRELQQFLATPNEAEYSFQWTV
jgi:hypothetical protein